MRHRRPPPDTRLDWRDPNMPCLRKCRNPWTGETAVRPFSPEEMTYQAQERLRDSADPHYSYDSTYNLRRK